MNQMNVAVKPTIMAPRGAKLPLSKDAKRQLAQAYFKLYYGMSWLNWTDKKSSLGMAWQRALEQINAFAGAKDAKNPAGRYIRQINAAHQKQWPITIMTHENSDKKLTGTDEQIAMWRTSAQRQINSALNTINAIMMQHRVKNIDLEKQQPAPKPQVQAKTPERTVAQAAATAPVRPARPPMSAAMQIAAPRIKAAARNQAQPVAETAKPAPTPKVATFDRAKQAMILKMLIYQRQNQRNS